MLSFFCIPKAFHGHIGIIQRNALRSWSKLEPSPEIIVIGDEAGTEDVVREIGAVWIKTVDKTTLGTPLLSHAFALAAKAATHPVLCYANSDIMFTNEIMEPVRNGLARRTLISGRCWNTDITVPWDFSTAKWQESLRDFAGLQGKLGFYYAMDYFIFERASPLTKLPPFAVGRPGWDNSFIYRARRHGLRVIDATEAIKAVHQNHDYNHVPKRTGPAWEGPEADANLALLFAPEERHFTLNDATHLLTKSGLVKADTETHRIRRRWAFRYVYPKTERLLSLIGRPGSLLKRFTRKVASRIKRAVMPRKKLSGSPCNNSD